MLVNAFDRRKTDFRSISRLELRSQRGGDDLMPQAHAQHRLAHTDRSPRELGLGLQSRILVVVERTHRPAHDHHAGNLAKIRQIRFLLLGDIDDLILQAQIIQTV